MTASRGCVTSDGPPGRVSRLVMRAEPSGFPARGVSQYLRAEIIQWRPQCGTPARARERTREQGNGGLLAFPHPRHRRAVRPASQSLFFDPIFSAHQRRHTKQDQATKPDDGSKLHERSVFGSADTFDRNGVPPHNSNSAEYAAKPPYPEQNDKDNAGDAERRPQWSTAVRSPSRGCPKLPSRASNRAHRRRFAKLDRLAA